MNIPTVEPPKRRGKGYAPKLTPMQEIDAWSWHKAVEFLGTRKTKAAELGISETSLNSFIARMKRREREGR